MKIAYLGSLITSDSEFPLIRELQRHSSEEIIFYLPAEGKLQKGGIFNLKLFETDKIISATEYEEFEKVQDYFDISKIFIINNYHRKIYDIRSWLIWIKFIVHVKRQGVDIFHIVWPYRRQKLLLFFLNIKTVMTVHDPIPHSGQISSFMEYIRLINFKRSSKLLLLSDVQKDDFLQRYHIAEKKIVLSRFGYYDWIDIIYNKHSDIRTSKRYILFCGQIQSHKGVDVLLDAMLQVHKVDPELECVVAGSGQFYFDIEPFRSLSYIRIKNYFISMDEMIGLICDSLFVVCPYKDATQSGIVQIVFSSGKPLIVTNVGALPKSVMNEFTGLVVPPLDVDALAEAIIRLAGDDSLRSMFEKNINSIWKKESSWEDVVDDYLEMYESLS